MSASYYTMTPDTKAKLWPFYKVVSGKVQFRVTGEPWEKSIHAADTISAAASRGELISVTAEEAEP